MSISLDEVLSLFFTKLLILPNWIHLRKFKKEKQTTGKLEAIASIKSLKEI